MDTIITATTPVFITATTPLFGLEVRDPQEPRFYYVLLRDHAQVPPHVYDWPRLIAPGQIPVGIEREDQNLIDEMEQRDRRYGQDFLRSECFTTEEAEVIQAHVRSLGCEVRRRHIVLPTKYVPYDTYDDDYENRNFWQEGVSPCALHYCGFFGVDTALMPGL